MVIKFPFDETAAISALLYLLKNANDKGYHKILKMMYLADKCHLERYGRQIFGGEYRAYDFGPVAQNVYGLLKQAEKRERGLSPKGAFRVYKSGRKPLIEALGIYDSDELSESDIECLDTAIKELDKLDFSRTTDQSHDEAWRSAYDTNPNTIMTVENIVLTLNHGEKILQHLQDPHP